VPLFCAKAVQVNKADEGTLSETKEPFNYFNYFTEIEEEFVRRRGKPLFISPMDWALIESWKTAGIPLHVVLRAINDAFDAYDARVRKYRKVNSIFYCEQTVETMFAAYRLSQVGAPPAFSNTGESDQPSPLPKQAGSAFTKDVILDFLDNSYKELAVAENFAREQQKNELEEAIKRSRKRLRVIAEEISSAAQINDEALEHDLDAIDRMILKSITQSQSDSQRLEISEEAESHLKAYKKKMDKKIFEQTLQNFRSRRLRELHRIPRLSLFYI
jgi:hypothetical protein